jgi:sister-chromatid-cohesion protein PDS5
VNKKLISHKDFGVQSLVACCLSDILRIYAPDAPYTDRQLSDIFKLFIKQFQRLADPDNAYYTQQVYLLTRSAEVRSIILVTDISNSTQLIENIFEFFYDSSHLLHKKLEPIISDVLIEIISEWDHISTIVLKLILNKFLTNNEKSVSSALSSSSISAFNLSLNICNANPDRLARYLTKFFSEVLFENNDEESEILVKNLHKIHKLSVEIWKHVPEILGSVMGLIDNELSADDPKVRVIATETVGKILAASSRINFVHVHKQTWITWMKKTLDISPNVRSKWVDQTGSILTNRSDLNQEIANGLSKTLIDTDERVRLSTIKTIGNLPPSIVLEKLSGESILNSIVQLTREKQPEIREEAITILGRLFNESYDLLRSTDPSQYDSSLNSVKGIPNHILNLYYINDKNINYLVDVTLLESILPSNDDELERAERLIYVFGSLDAKAKASFIAFNKRQQQLSNVLKKLLEFAEENNGGSVGNVDLESKIEKTIDWLAVTIPDHFSPADAIKRMVLINNRRLYYLLKIIISDSSDYKSLKNSTKEFFTRIQDTKIVNSVKGQGTFSIKYLISTFKILIFRASPSIFNRSNISSLLKLNQNEEYRKVSQELIDNISTISPSSFQNETANLVKLIKESTPGEGETTYANTLKAIFHIFRKLTSFLDNSDFKFFDKIIEFGKVGNPSEARYAVKVLSLADKKEIFFTQLFEAIYPLDKDNEHIASHLAAISQLFLVAPYIPEGNNAELTPFLIKNILLKNSVSGDDEDPNWISDEKLDNTDESSLAAKIYAIKTFTNSLRAAIDSDSEAEESTKSVAEHVLKLFGSLIGNGGEIVSSKSENYPTPKHYQSRLRLEAGLNLLKLAKFPFYNKLIKPQLVERLVLLIQDENEEVRSRFIHKLTRYLKNQEISLKFLPLVYMIAYEPLESLKSDIKTWIKTSFNNVSKPNCPPAKKDIVLEKSLSGLIHTIAHHSEFLDYINAEEDIEENTLKAYTFSLEYIAFFLDTVSNEQNISLLYYLASRVKQYRDASFDDQAFDNDEAEVSHIYKLADLTQLAIKELQDQKGWILSSYPGRIELSSDLFKPMKTVQEGQSVLSKSYIDEEALKKIRGIVKQKIGALSNVKRARSHGESSSSVPKAKKTKVEATKKAKRQYRRKTVDEDEDRTDATFHVTGATRNTEPIRKSSRSARISYAQNSDEDGNIEESEEGEKEEDDDDDDT